MTADAIAWVAAEAGFPLLSEAGSRLTASPAARERIGDAKSLVDALARIVGVGADDPALVDFVRRARSGLRVSKSFASQVLLSVPERPADVRVLVLPRAAESSVLAAGVTHELNNALGAIVGWVELARRPDASEDDVDRALGRIDESAQAARDTARGLLESGRLAVPASADLLDVVTEVVAALEPLGAAANVRIEPILGEGPLSVPLSRPQLYTAVSNLLRNAIEASPAGAIVAIEARRARGRARIEVADSGHGISEADRARIFEPYFTTKREGTGLGLPLVRHVVESVEGRVNVRSQPGRGARFVIDLPLAGERQRKAAPPRPAVGRKRSGVRARSAELSGTVLVVEDDAAMRDLLTTALELHGATVVTCENATEALSAQGPFDLALLDLGLDVRGDRLLAELRRSGSVRVAALVSGSAPAPDLHPEGRPDAWLRKPFDIDDLLAVVASLRARTSATADG